jgi:hypothetical protein
MKGAWVRIASSVQAWRCAGVIGRKELATEPTENTEKEKAHTDLSLCPLWALWPLSSYRVVRFGRGVKYESNI